MSSTVWHSSETTLALFTSLATLPIARGPKISLSEYFSWRNWLGTVKQTPPYSDPKPGGWYSNEIRPAHHDQTPHWPHQEICGLRGRIRGRITPNIDNFIYLLHFYPKIAIFIYLHHCHIKIDISFYLLHYHVKIVIIMCIYFTNSWLRHRNKVHEHQWVSSSLIIDFGVCCVLAYRCFRVIVYSLMVWHNIYSFVWLFGFRLIRIWAQEITSSIAHCTQFSHNRLFLRMVCHFWFQGCSVVWVASVLDIESWT